MSNPVGFPVKHKKMVRQCWRRTSRSREGARETFLQQGYFVILMLYQIIKLRPMGSVIYIGTVEWQKLCVKVCKCI